MHYRSNEGIYLNDLSVSQIEQVCLENNLSKKLSELEMKNKLLSTNLNFDYVDMMYREKLKLGKKDELIIKLK